jgi:hypothetical protein
MGEARPIGRCAEDSPAFPSRLDVVVTQRRGTQGALFGMPVKPTGTVERKAIATLRKWKLQGVDVDELAARQVRSLANTIDRAEAAGDLGAATRANLALAQVQVMLGLRDAPDRDAWAELAEQLKANDGPAQVRYTDPA